MSWAEYSKLVIDPRGGGGAASFCPQWKIPGIPQGKVRWQDILISRLSDSIKLVGPTISCEGSPKDGDVNGTWRTNPHVQSYVLVTDKVPPPPFPPTKPLLPFLLSFQPRSSGAASVLRCIKCEFKWKLKKIENSIQMFLPTASLLMANRLNMATIHRGWEDWRLVGGVGKCKTRKPSLVSISQKSLSV